MNAAPNTAALRGLLERVEAGEWDMFASVANAVGIDNAATASSAFSGSLDAAKALHDALLPCQSFGIGDINAGVYTKSGFRSEQVKDGNPARAWLIAIIRAMIDKDTK